jgi:hypothetical protein
MILDTEALHYELSSAGPMTLTVDGVELAPTPEALRARAAHVQEIVDRSEASVE